MADETVKESTITCKVKFEGEQLTDEQQGIIEKIIFKSLQKKIQKSVDSGEVDLDVDYTDVYHDLYCIHREKFNNFDIDVDREPEIKSINEGIVWFVVKVRRLTPRYLTRIVGEVRNDVYSKTVDEHLRQPEVEKKIKEEIAKQIIDKVSEVMKCKKDVLRVEFTRPKEDSLFLDIKLSSTDPEIQTIIDEMNSLKGETNG